MVFESWSFKKRAFLLFFCFFAFQLCSIAFAADVVTISNTSKKEVFSLILENELKNGYMIKSSSDYSLITQDTQPKPLKFQLNWGDTALFYHVFNFADVADGTLLSVELQIVTNPGTGQERVYPLTKEAAQGYVPGNKEDALGWAKISYQYATSVKYYFNGFWLYGFTNETKKTKDYIEIKSVDNGLPANIAGILPGDKIIKVNDRLVKDYSYDAMDEMLKAGEEGASITLLIRRGDKEIPFMMTKQFIPPQYKKKPQSPATP